MKKYLSVVIACLALLILLFACDDKAAFSQIVEYSTPTIKGTITIPDGSNVKPEEVYVKVIDSDDKTVTIQKASSDGTFVIQNLSEKMTYRILFTSEEPEFNNRSITRGKGSGVGGWLNDVVPAVKEGNDVGSVKMKPLGTIKGKALIDGKSEHYDITVYIPGTSYSAITDKDGNFSIYSVPEGTYTLRYILDDYVPVMTSGVMLVCPDGAENPEKIVGDVKLQSNRGTVSGKAVLGDSNDSTGITIKLESKDKSISYNASTSSDGNYIINDVAPGRYRVIASYSTYTPQASGYFDVATATVTTVTERIELLGDYGTLKGSVSLADSENKEGIQILIKEKSGTNSFAVITDTDGSFTKKLKPGEYIITASFAGYTSLTESAVIVANSEKELIFSPLKSNYGSVSGKSFTPGETVVLVDSTGTAVATIVTPNDCKYIFSKITPGTYSVRFSKTNYVSFDKTDVLVAAGSTTTVDGESLVSKYGTVSGFITLEGASDNAGVIITLTDSSDSENVYSEVSASDGSFRITEIAKSGTYLLTYSKDGYVSNLSNSVDVTVGKVSTVSSVTLKSVVSTVSGKIVLDGASTHENVTILLKNETKQYNATTDQKGEYKINGVLPGTYTLIASKDGYVTASTSEFVIESSSEKNVELLTLSVAIRSITGSVKLELLTDYAGALVTATNLADSTKVYSAITNSAGQYTLAGMTPGEYSIVISYNGYRTATLATVNVVSSTVTNIPLTEMQIDRGTISGVVTLEGRSSSNGITVELLRGSAVYETTTTDESGSYSFYVPQGNYTGVRYSCTDFASTSISKSIALFADNYFSMGNETLAATHNSVYGTVDVLTTDDESAVTISFDGVTTIESFVTTADGSFRFDHVPVGSYTLRFQRQDCSDITIPVEVKADDGINLGKVEVTPNTATIKGKVNLKNGISLSGVKVSVNLGTKVLETLTDDSGRYEIGGVSIADEYTVTYSKDGWDNKTQKISPKLNILEVRELDEITLVDTTSPVISSVVINSGANTTANKKITLNLSASDTGSGLEKIMVTYDNVFDKTVRRYDYSSIFEWELPAENGTYTVYVKVVDRAGNESASYSASVNLTDQKTEVSGVLSGDKLTWTKDKSPYLVVGSVMVEKDTTLIIEPGVDVQFAGNYGITVEGTTKAIGTENEKISFYGVDSGKNNWIGINCKYDNQSMLSYIDLQGSTKGLQGYMTVLNSALESSSYVLCEFVGELCDSIVEGAVYAKDSSLIGNTFNLRYPSNSIISGTDLYDWDTYGAEYFKNGIMNSYLTGNTFEGDSLCFGGTGENNQFKNMTVATASSNTDTTFDSCILYLRESMGFSGVETSSYFTGSSFLKCVFDDCEFREFNPSVIRDSNFIEFDSVIQIKTKFSDYEVVDLTSNFWGYANTAELQANGLKTKHSFIKDYYADGEFSITRANLSNFRIEPNTDAGYKGDSYSRYLSESTIEYFVGDAGPAGGIVFYDKGYYSNGWRYLEAAPTDVITSSLIFGYYKTTENSNCNAIGSSTVIGAGRLNSEMLVSVMGEVAYNKYDDGGDLVSDYASKKCLDYEYGGYDDWFLPSKEELNLIYVNLHKKGLGSFGEYNSYWSSSEGNSDYAWGRNFYYGYQDYNGRNSNFYVRPVRAF